MLFWRKISRFAQGWGAHINVSFLHSRAHTRKEKEKQKQKAYLQPNKLLLGCAVDKSYQS